MTTRRVKDGTAGTARARKRAAGSRAVTGGALVEGASWREGYNPTKRLTVERAVWLMECYSRGMFAELMSAPERSWQCACHARRPFASH